MHRHALQIIILLVVLMTCSQCASSQIRGQSVQEYTNHPQSYPIHGSDLLWKQELTVRKYIAEHPDAMKSTTLRKTNGWGFTVGSTKSWYADNFVNNSRYQVHSTCRAVGINCYIFVEDSSWNNGRVNQSAVDSIRIYFDSKTPANPTQGIFQMDTSAFGIPPDVDHDPKIILLLLDIKDGYNGTGGYVEGYFYDFNEVNPTQPGFPTSNFAEMFFLDANPLDLKTSTGLYDGISTLAHEFQHMIHFNYDPNEISFVNEGCSLIAEVNCGFPIYNQSLYANETNHYLFDWRSGDMTAVLADYSRAARFFVYVRDQVGIGVFRKIVDSPLHGRDGINAGLQTYGSSFRFDDILQTWFIANILDDRTIDPRYGYLYPNLPKAAERTYFNPNVSIRVDTVRNYAVQYLAFKNGSQLKTTFTISNPSLLLRAVEIGSASKRVLDVASGTEFSEPQFGSTYKEIHFIVMNVDPSTPYSYTDQASGTNTVVELKYDLSEPTGYLQNTAGDTICVLFDAIPGGRIDSVRVALRRAGTIIGGVWTYSGSPRPSPLGRPLAVPISATVYSTPVYSGDPLHPYPVPWPNWASIDLHSKSISSSSAFAIAFVCAGDPTTQPRVMITESPIPSTITSWTYDSQNETPAWYYYTSNETGDSVYTYLIRVYVSFDTMYSEPDTELHPTHYLLSQNYPNPFNPGTKIDFTLPNDSKVSLKVYDILGREVSILINNEFFKTSSIPYTVSFNGSNLPSGVYFYRITAGNFIQTKKLVLLK